MRADVAYANSALDAWASWVRGNHRAWPSRTVLARVIDEGVFGAAQCRDAQIMPMFVLRTDRAVARIEQPLRQVIKVYYLVHAASEIKAAMCQISRATFWRRVERGQIAVFRELTTETDDSYSMAPSPIPSFGQKSS